MFIVVDTTDLWIQNAYLVLQILFTFKALEKGDINNGKNKNNDNTNNNNVVAQSRIDLSKRYLFHGPMDSWKADQCFLLAMMYFVCINLNVLLQER